MAWVESQYSIPAVSISYVFGGSKEGSWVACSIPRPSTTFYCQPRLSHSVTISGYSMSASLQFADASDAVRMSVDLGGAGSGPLGTGYIYAPQVKTWLAADIAKVRLVASGTAASFSASASGTLIVWVESDGTPGGNASCDPKKLAIVTGGKAGSTITRLRYKIVQSLDGSMDWSGTISGDKVYQLTD